MKSIGPISWIRGFFCVLLLAGCVGPEATTTALAVTDTKPMEGTGPKEPLNSPPVEEVLAPPAPPHPVGEPPMKQPAEEIKTAVEPTIEPDRPVKKAPPSVAVPAVMKPKSNPAVIQIQSPAVGSVEVNPRAYSLNPCETKQYSASVKDKEGQGLSGVRVIWELSNPKVAKIDEKGLATGLSPGFTLIRAAAGNAKSDPVSLFVRDKGIAPDCK